MDKKSSLTEVEVRNLRAEVFGECSDDNWNNCRQNWMRADSVEFLKKHAKIPLGTHKT